MKLGYVRQLRNIRIGTQPAHLFQVPQGLRKVELQPPAQVPRSPPPQLVPPQLPPGYSGDGYRWAADGVGSGTEPALFRSHIRHQEVCRWVNALIRRAVAGIGGLKLPVAALVLVSALEARPVAAWPMYGVALRNGGWASPPTCVFGYGTEVLYLGPALEPALNWSPAQWPGPRILLARLRGGDHGRRFLVTRTRVGKGGSMVLAGGSIRTDG